jgi:UDP-2,3-diacylglucosamine pyrophosphatase LpxH
MSHNRWRNVPWSEADEKKLVRAVDKASSKEEALRLVQLAIPDRKPTLCAINNVLRRLNLPSLHTRLSAKERAVGKSDQDAELAQFVSIAKNGYTLEELCDKVDASPKKVRAMVEAAKASGYRIDFKAGSIGYVPHQPLRSEKKLIAQPGDPECFGVISDLHIGSKFCLEDQLRDFIIRAHKEDGVRQFFLPGDNLDGCYRHSKWEEAQHGFTPQAERMAKVLPSKKQDGVDVRYAGIIGNHDETFEKDSGLDVCRATEDVFRRAGRDDLQLYGARGAYLRYAPKGGRGVLVELWHPLGGGAYAVSYKLQRHVEEYGIGQKADILLTGHWHQQCYIVRRGVHAFSCGTFHGGGSSFGKALGGAQAIGGWVIRYRQTKEGTIRDLTPTWRGYYETERIRNMGLG